MVPGKRGYSMRSAWSARSVSSIAPSRSVSAITFTLRCRINSTRSITSIRLAPSSRWKNRSGGTRRSHQRLSPPASDVARLFRLRGFFRRARREIDHFLFPEILDALWIGDVSQTLHRCSDTVRGSKDFSCDLRDLVLTCAIRQKLRVHDEDCQDVVHFVSDRGSRFGDAGKALSLCGLRFHLPLEGHVLHLPDEVARSARGVVDGRDRNPNPDHSAVFPEIALDPVIAGDVTLNELSLLFEIPRDVLGVRDLRDFHFTEFVFGIPEHVAQGLVCAKPLPVEPNQTHPVRRVSEGVAESLFTL